MGKLSPTLRHVNVSGCTKANRCLQNDCAITKKDDEQVYVLQTLPGILFRLRVSMLGYSTALKYYRGVVEARESNSESHEALQRLIGDGYSPLYVNTIKVVPDAHSTLVDVDMENPLGRGSNGVVYAAILRCERPVLSTSMSGDVPIVLKDYIARKSDDAMRKFMREVSKPCTFLPSPKRERERTKADGIGNTNFTVLKKPYIYIHTYGQ